MQKKSFLILFLTILLLGMLVRIYDLGKESIWTDEAYTLMDIKGSSSQVIRNIEKIEVVPPLYFFIIKLWTASFGESEFDIRILSAVFGILNILAIGILSYSLFRSYKAALLTSLLQGVSLIDIVYSQEARFYEISLFFMLISFYFFLEYFKRDSKKHLILFTIFSIVSLYLNYIGAIPFLICLYIILLSKKERAREFILYSFLPIVILSLPIVVLAIVQFLNVIPLWPIRLVNLGVPLNLAWLILISLILIFAFAGLLSPIIIYYKRDLIQKLKDNQRLAIIICSVFSIALLALLSKITHSISLIRYFLFILAGFYLYLGYTCVKKPMGNIILAVLLLTNIVGLIYYYQVPTKPDWKNAVEFIDNTKLPDSIILFDRGMGANRFIFDYYSKDSNQSKLDLRGISDGIPIEDLHQRIGSHKYAFLILSKNKDDYYLEGMAKLYSVEMQRDFYSVRVMLFKIS